MVKRRRLELPRHNCHYPLKVARLPIPPPLRYVCNLLITSNYSAQNRTRTCTSLLTLVPETSASTIPPPGLVELRCCKQKERKTRLELATPTLARLCSTNWAISAKSDSYRIQTYNLLIRSQMLYSVELRSQLLFFVTPIGFKPITFWSVVRCSIQLS